MGWYGEDDELPLWYKIKFFIEHIPYYLTTRKCLEDRCNRRCKPPTMYCSYTCAAYDGVFNVRTGWDEAAVKQKHPKEWQHCHKITMKKLKDRGDDHVKDKETKT